MSTYAALPTDSLPLDHAPSGSAVRLRRVVGAASLPATFAVMLVGTVLLDPLNDRANETTTLHQAVGHAGQIAGLAWAEMLLAVLVIAGLMTVVGAIRGRGAGWANATGMIALASGAGVFAVAMSHFLVSGLTSSTLSTAQRVQVLERFHSAGGPVIVLIVIGMLGFVTAALAMWRARLSSRLVLVPAVALLVLSTAPSEIANYASMAAGLVLTAWMARDLLRV